MTLNDYPPWIQSAAKEIEEVAMMPANELAEIISRHHEVEPKFLPQRPKDIMRAITAVAAMAHGCHACGEERPARIVAGKLTCPECGSENITRLD